MDTQGIKKFGKGVYSAWRGLVWFLRWLSIVLFGVLFFVGIYFKLPWKVLACIAIIPVVGIFVPKKIQPWIWGSLTLLIVSLWGWVYLPERNSDPWRPYEYTDALETIATGYFGAGANNAADLYTDVLEEYGETVFSFQFSDDQAARRTLSDAWDPADYPFLDFWITEMTDGINRLIEAGSFPECRFEIPYNLAATKPQLQRINQIKGWVRILVWAANRDMFLGDPASAFIKLKAALQIAQHLYQQQTLFDQAAAFHIELLAARGLETLMIDHCSDPQMLSEIEALFDKLDPDWAGSWPDILLREKLTVKNLAGIMYEVNDSGRVRISHNAMMDLQAGLGFPPQRLFFNQHQMNRIAVIGLWLALPASPQRLAAMVDERFDHYSLQVQKGLSVPRYPFQYVWVKGLNAQSVIDWLAMQQVGYFWALDGQYLRHLSIVNQIRIFSALKRYHLQHQRWPQKLEDLDIPDAQYVLRDPLCRRPFAYELTDYGFRLYSLGSNGIDDGAENIPLEKKDDILLWPRMGTEGDIDL